jgi:uncharacterized protein YdcH (DUF465 family)
LQLTSPRNDFFDGTLIREGGFMKEQEIVAMLRDQNSNFRQLDDEHRALEGRLSELDSKHFLTPEEEMEVKTIKKKKLARKDKMATYIREFKKGVSMN